MRSLGRLLLPLATFACADVQNGSDSWDTGEGLDPFSSEEAAACLEAGMNKAETQYALYVEDNSVDISTGIFHGLTVQALDDLNVIVHTEGDETAWYAGVHDSEPADGSRTWLTYSLVPDGGTFAAFQKRVEDETLYLSIRGDAAHDSDGNEAPAGNCFNIGAFRECEDAENLDECEAPLESWPVE